MVNINNSQMANSKSITNAIFDSYYPRSKNFPNGKIVVENTSFGKNGVSGKTLTSRTISEAISGDVLYRSPKFATTFYNKSIGSSLNSLITAGSESTFDSPSILTIQDPESIANTDDDGTPKATTLKGGAAFARILAESIAGKQAGSSFIQDAGESLYDNYVTSASKSEEDPASTDPDASLGADPGNPAIGGRMVALSSKMTAEEKGWILERGKVLADTGLFEGRGSSLRSGWNFDIVNGLTGITTKDGASDFPGVDPAINTINVSQETIDAPAETAYIAPALIEFLILLSSKITYYAGFGTSRWTDDTVKNHMVSNTSLSAHGFGRAVDISSVTTKDGITHDVWNSGGSVEVYRQFMEVLLPAINSMPMHLIPDLLGFAGPLQTEYGVTNGKDADDAAIKLRFPNLKYVRWYPADDHLNHIHIAFSPSRAGVYTGPGGAFTTGSTNLSQDEMRRRGPRTTTPDPGIATPSNGGTLNSKFIQLSRTYGTQLIADEIYNLLNITCVPELAAIMTAISQREGNVSTLNADILGDGDWNGDWSYGFLQNNLFGTHGKLEVLVPYPTPIKIHAWKLAAPAWQYFNLSSWEQWKGFIKDNFNQVGLESFTTTARSSSDDRIWYPINQVYMAYRFMCGRDPTYPLPLADRLGANGPEMQHVLTPWGDYGGVPGGPLFGTKFRDAAYVYRNSGKTEEDLKDWVRKYFAYPGNGATSKSAPKVEDWLAGKRILRDGTIQEWEA
jgi:hypothetical protein